MFDSSDCSRLERKESIEASQLYCEYLLEAIRTTKNLKIKKDKILKTFMVLSQIQSIDYKNPITWSQFARMHALSDGINPSERSGMLEHIHIPKQACDSEVSKSVFCQTKSLHYSRKHLQFLDLFFNK